MARTRQIKPEFFKNEELVNLGFDHMILFAGLWTLADREGRLKDRIPVIHGEVFPYTPLLPLDEMLSSLGRSGFIQRYTFEGHRYIQIVNFTEHQNPHRNEVQSVIPLNPIGTERLQPKDETTSTKGRSDSRSINTSSNTSSNTPAHKAPSQETVLAKDQPIIKPPDGPLGY